MSSFEDICGRRARLVASQLLARPLVEAPVAALSVYRSLELPTVGRPLAVQARSVTLASIYLSQALPAGWTLETFLRVPPDGEASLMSPGTFAADIKRVPHAFVWRSANKRRMLLDLLSSATQPRDVRKEAAAGRVAGLLEAGPALWGSRFKGLRLIAPTARYASLLIGPDGAGCDLSDTEYSIWRAPERWRR